MPICLLYLGTRATGILLNPAPLYDTLYSDSAYTGGERLYTLVAVDAAGSESVGRSLLLPDLALEPLGDGELYRGITNRLQYQVTNQGSGRVQGARLGIDAGGHAHGSARKRGRKRGPKKRRKRGQTPLVL